MDGKIYVIRNYDNEKVYVGQTTQSVEKRFRQHLMLRKTSSNQLIYRAIKAHGKEKFYYEILESGIDTEEELNEKEIYYIEKLNALTPNGYNLCPGGNAWRWCKPNGYAQMSNEVKAAIVSKYAEGKSTRALAEEYHTDHGVIRRVLREAGAPIRSRSCHLPDRTSKATLPVLQDLYLKKGMSAREIANVLGMSDNSVRRQIRKFGIKRIKNSDVKVQSA